MLFSSVSNQTRFVSTILQGEWHLCMTSGSVGTHNPIEGINSFRNPIFGTEMSLGPQRVYPICSAHLVCQPTRLSSRLSSRLSAAEQQAEQKAEQQETPTFRL